MLKSTKTQLKTVKANSIAPKVAKYLFPETITQTETCSAHSAALNGVKQANETVIFSC